jgi:hypothetical protein
MSRIYVEKIVKIKYRFELGFDKGLENECWNWKKSKNKKGYGQFGIGHGTCYPAHRISYELYIGKIPRNMLVCHSCDNPSCVNPSHLWLGTIQQNNIDRDNKGRFVKQIGINHPGCKLTEEIVREIKKRIKTGEPMTYIARDLNINYSTIANIKYGSAWNHI